MNLPFPALWLTSVLLFSACSAPEPAEPTETHPETTPMDHAEPTEQTLNVRLEVPTPAWSVSIEAVHIVEDELWVTAQLSVSDAMTMQVITEVSDSLTLPAPELPIRVFVLGKRFGWTPREDYQYPEDETAFYAERDRGQQIHP